MSVQSTPNLDRHQVEDMSIEELRREYIALKTVQYSQHFEEEILNKKIEMLREESVRLQQSTEIEEEHVANQLLRRLNDAERSVRKYEQLIHEEEEAMEELTKQISEISAQQREIKSQLEKHQEQHILLQGKLLNTRLKKSELGRELLDEWQRYLGVLVNQLAVLRDKEERESGGRGFQPTASPTNAEKSTAAETAIMPNPASVDAQPSSPSQLRRDCCVLEAPHEEPVNSPSMHPTVVRLEKQLNKLLEEHAKALRDAEEMKLRYSELSRRLKIIQDTAFLDIAQAARYREDLRDAQAKLLELNFRSGVC